MLSNNEGSLLLFLFSELLKRGLKLNKFLPLFLSSNFAFPKSDEVWFVWLKRVDVDETSFLISLFKKIFNEGWASSLDFFISNHSLWFPSREVLILIT